MDPAETIQYFDQLLADVGSALTKLRRAQLSPEEQKLLSRMRSTANAAARQIPERQPPASVEVKHAQDPSIATHNSQNGPSTATAQGTDAPPSYESHASSTLYSIPINLADKPSETTTRTASDSTRCYGCGSNHANCSCPSRSTSPATAVPASPATAPATAVSPRADGGMEIDSADVKKGDFLNELLHSSCRGNPSKILIVSQCLRTELMLHEDQVAMRALTKTYNAAFRKEAKEQDEGVEMRAKMCSIGDADSVILDRIQALIATRNSNRGQLDEQDDFPSP